MDFVDHTKFLACQSLCGVAFLSNYMTEVHHGIKMVARRTGLSAHVIRIWEKRYGAVEPARSGTNRRLYSESQIERLGLLRDVTRAGHSIGLVANLGTEELRKLAGEASGGNGPGARGPARAEGVGSPAGGMPGGGGDAGLGGFGGDAQARLDRAGRPGVAAAG